MSDPNINYFKWLNKNKLRVEYYVYKFVVFDEEYIIILVLTLLLESYPVKPKIVDLFLFCNCYGILYDYGYPAKNIEFGT